MYFGKQQLNPTRMNNFCPGFMAKHSGLFRSKIGYKLSTLSKKSVHVILKKIGFNEKN